MGLSGRWRTRPTTEAEPTVRAIARLLFGEKSSELEEGQLASIAPDGTIRTRGQIRQLLSSTERQFIPSPVTVRFGPDDRRIITTPDFKLSIDVADVSVGALIANTGEWEPHTSAVMHELVKPGMTVIDVGANVGWFTLLAASLVGQSGRVISVEPWSENCRLLLLSILENGFENIELWPVGLDRQRGWAHFMTHVGSNGGLISDSPEAIASGSGSIIPVFSLDELLGPDDNLDFVKIDVEGAESRVVAGAQKSLERCRPVVMSEFSVEMTQRVSGTDPREYLRWFTDRGWNLNVIDRGDGRLRPFGSPDDLLTWWPSPLHLEDLLFLPGA